MIATQQRAANLLANLHLPQLPTRNQIWGRATAMFAKTSSMDDIVDMAHMLILDAIGTRLLPPQNGLYPRRNMPPAEEMIVTVDHGAAEQLHPRPAQLRRLVEETIVDRRRESCERLSRCPALSSADLRSIAAAS
jgi:hypothetical protein